VGVDSIDGVGCEGVYGGVGICCVVAMVVECGVGCVVCVVGAVCCCH
jgi:hypothetical protein